MKKFLIFLVFIIAPFSKCIFANEDFFHLPSSPHIKPFFWLTERKSSNLRHKGEKTIGKIHSVHTSLVEKEANLRNLEKTLKKIEKVDSTALGSKELFMKEKFSSQAQDILNRHYLLKKESAIFDIPYFSESEEKQQLLLSSGMLAASPSVNNTEKACESFSVTDCTFTKQQDDSALADMTSPEEDIDKLSANFTASDTAFISTYVDIPLEESVENDSLKTTIILPVNLPRPPSFSALNQVILPTCSSVYPAKDPNILNNVSRFFFNRVKHRLTRITVISALIYLKNIYQLHKKKPQLEKIPLLKNAAKNMVHSKFFKIGIAMSLLIPRTPFE